MSQFIIVLANKDKWNAMCTSYGYTLVEAKFGKEKYLLCIRLVDMGKIETVPGCSGCKIVTYVLEFA